MKIDVKRLIASKLINLDKDHDGCIHIDLVNEGEYSAKFMWFYAEDEHEPHKHEIKKETFIVLDGLVDCFVDGLGGAILRVGDIITIPPGQYHKLQGYKKESLVLEIATHDDDDDTYYISGEGE